MKDPIRALCMTLGLAVLLVLPVHAAEPVAGSAAVQAASPGQAPAPLWMSGTVDCSSCASHTPNPAAQCNQYCRSQGYFVDTCEADASTCQLLTCYCMYDW